jgi:hypothetical protein
MAMASEHAVQSHLRLSPRRLAHHRISFPDLEAATTFQPSNDHHPASEDAEPGDLTCLAPAPSARH